MRIVGGKWAGRDLVSPGSRIRPTAEEVRARWLDLVESSLKGARVLDLFAGSGALGLEALSRGAASVDFVENGSASLHSLKANVAGLHARKKSRIFKRDAIPFVEALEEGAYDIAFADPPYGSRKLDRVVNYWQQVPFATILGVEHAREHRLEGKAKRYDFPGDTRVTLFTAPRRRPG